MLKIRKAIPDDAENLFELYNFYLTNNPPTETQDMEIWRKMIVRFEANPLYFLLVGEVGGKVVSSVTLNIIENLTHNVRPYGIIENVVTHKDYRNKGYATDMMNKAAGISRDYGCYKIMLMTSSKEESVLRFYKNCGYSMTEKTGFIKRL